MKSRAVTACLALLCTLMPWIAARAAMPDRDTVRQEVDSGRLDLASFDFGAAGFWELRAEERLDWYTGLVPSFDPSSPMRDTRHSCTREDQRLFTALVWSRLAVQAKDEKDWREAHVTLLARAAKLDRMLDAAAAVDVSGLAPREAELRQHFARDQAIRGVRDTWTPNMPLLADRMWDGVRDVRLKTVDCENRRWLQAQLSEFGWFDARKWGADADDAAWQLVEHIEFDSDLLLQAIEVLRKLPKGATSQKRLAQLDDRVAFEERRPQRFGTQQKCVFMGGSKFWPDVEDPAHLNERRAAVGLEPVDLALMAKDPNCPPPGGWH